MQNVKSILAASCLVLGLAGGLHTQAQEVSTDRAIYLPNEPVVVRFKSGLGNLKDWVGLYAENAQNDSILIWQYLDGSQTGKAPLSDGQTLFQKGISKPGSYEVRFFENDGYSLMAEKTFTVAHSPRLFSSKPIFLPTESIQVAFTNSSGHVKDWVGLFQTGAPNANPSARQFLDGTTDGTSSKTNGALVFDPVLPDGAQEARLFGGETGDLLDTLLIETGYPRPVVTVATQDRRINISWTMPVWPVSVAKYVVLSRLMTGSTFEVIAEVVAGTGVHTYQHIDLPRGEERCYVIRAEGLLGKAASSSVPLCASASEADGGGFVAFDVPSGTPGNQSWPGALGMDFEVVNPIAISHLGVFDDGGNGLKRTITVRLLGLTSKNLLATMEFSPTSPGVLIGGSRFKPLQTPVALTTGFKGIIVAEGYGPEETAGNASLGSLPRKTSSGNGAILFVGKGRYGRAGTFPVTIDKGPANPYAAGTFQFRVTEVTAPGKPDLTTMPDDKSVTLSWPAVTQPLPAAKYRIFRSEGGGGAFTQIAEIPGTEYRDANLTNGQELCYRVRAIGETGVQGPESDTECQTPDPVEAGVAYINPAELSGNQDFGGSVGNDFDLVRPIRVTRLGAFDDRSDGFKRPISVRLYDRVTASELAKLTFTTGDPGELVEGSRFKNISPPLVLSAGFQGTIVASGYGPGELIGNEGIPGTADLNLELFRGGCLRFVGLSRFGEDPDAFPQIIDGGPENRYAAGTFYFEPDTASVPLKLIVSRVANGIQLRWEGVRFLETADSVLGPWETIPGALSGRVVTASERSRFFKLRQ